MRFEDERYVRLYTKNTPGWCIVPWQARAVLPLVLRALDRAGIVELGSDGFEALAALVMLPVDVVDVGMKAWLARGTFELRGTTLTMPKFLEAQEAKASDAQRAREKRARDRERARTADGPEHDPPRPITPRDEAITHRDAASRSVTDRHAESRGVTPSCAVPSRTDPVPPLAGLGGPGGSSPPSGERVRATKGSRMTRDWSPTEEVIAFATREGVNAAACLDEFRDYWLGVSGAKGVKADWDATFRNRVRKLLEEGRAPMLPAPEPAATPAIEPDPKGVAKVQALLAEVGKARVVSLADRKGVNRGT